MRQEDKYKTYEEFIHWMIDNSLLNKQFSAIERAIERCQTSTDIADLEHLLDCEYEFMSTYLKLTPKIEFYAMQVFFLYRSLLSGISAVAEFGRFRQIALAVGLSDHVYFKEEPTWKLCVNVAGMNLCIPQNVLLSWLVANKKISAAHSRLMAVVEQWNAECGLFLYDEWYMQIVRPLSEKDAAKVAKYMEILAEFVREYDLFKKEWEKASGAFPDLWEPYLDFYASSGCGFKQVRGLLDITLIVQCVWWQGEDDVKDEKKNKWLCVWMCKSETFDKVFHKIESAVLTYRYKKDIPSLEQFIHAFDDFLFLGLSLFHERWHILNDVYISCRCENGLISLDDLVSTIGEATAHQQKKRVPVEVG